jgi:hypothetical protein
VDGVGCKSRGIRNELSSILCAWKKSTGSFAHDISNVHDFTLKRGEALIPFMCRFHTITEGLFLPTRCTASICMLVHMNDNTNMP